MVLMHGTSSECALQMFEVSFNISDGYQVIEPTQFCDRQTIKQTQGENINARVMVLVHDMSSERALQMYEVSLKYH